MCVRQGVSVIRLHPFSLAIGAVLAFAAFVCMSQVAIQPFPSARFQYGPHPRDFVRIQEGAPFTVPAGRILVITAVGGPLTPSIAATVQVNGVGVTNAFADIYYNSPLTVRPISRFVTARAGDVVGVVGLGAAGTDARCWGYLSELTPGLAAGTLRPILEYQPHPQDSFAVVEGTPYVVPPGMLCVVTAVGTRIPAGLGQGIHSTLRVNGNVEVQVGVQLTEFAECSTPQLPPGFVYGPGSTVDVQAQFPGFEGRALCYLAAQ
jgi:hypothetical protein